MCVNDGADWPVLGGGSYAAFGQLRKGDKIQAVSRKQYDFDAIDTMLPEISAPAPLNFVILGIKHSLLLNWRHVTRLPSAGSRRYNVLPETLLLALYA